MRPTKCLRCAECREEVYDWEGNYHDDWHDWECSQHPDKLASER